MIGNVIKEIGGTISPGVPGAELIREWVNQQKLNIAPQTTLETDGEKFKIIYRDTWTPEALKHSFSLVVKKVSNLEADRMRRPKVEPKIEWSE